MKLTKKLEAEVLKAYKAYWEAYFKGDMKTFASMLDDDITVFGTAVSEVFNNKKEALKFYKATAGQLVGKVQLRNRQISLQSVDENILINEQGDFYALLEGKWTYYGQARVSAILKQTKTGWKLIHQHASFPDTRADEGEQLAAEKIKEENLQLRDAVKRRTIELEEKNRELQIEAAVERVRAKALAMHQSEDIHEVVRTLRDELFGLNLEGVTAVTICLKQDDGRIRLWDITDLETTGRYSLDITFNIGEIDPKLWIRQIWSSKKKIVAFEQDSNDLKRTLKWVSEHDKKMADELRELIRINKIKHGWHRAVKLANGRLITDFINEPPAEIESILLKMGAAFDLAYKRFLDLEKAEAQAKEARLESSLERVRSKTMAMHKSEEVTAVAVSLNEELVKLGFAGGSTIIIIDKETGDTEQWTGFSEDKTLQSCYVPYFKHPCHDAMLNAWKKRQKFFVYTLAGKEKKSFDQHYFKTGYKHFPERDKTWMRQMESVTFSHAFMKYGAIHWGPGQLREDQLGILQRFSKVFEQCYTRFLDLQKAETQAREAKIEAALERVRSQSMAMHKSDDLHEVIKVVTEQLTLLNVKFNVANFAKIDPDGSWDLWLSTPEQAYPALIHVPYLDHPIFNDISEQVASNNDFFTRVYNPEEASIFFHHFFENTIAKNTPEERKRYVYSSKGFTRSLFLTKNIWFSVSRYDPVSFTEEENAIFKRFANVFEQAYTRFLDLQKAEAQAKEARIEASLERVRSRTMGMQKSEELKEVIQVVYEQFVHLSIHIEHTGFIIDYKTNDDMHIWLADQHQVPSRVTIPYFDCAHWNSFIDAKEKGLDFFSNHLSFEEKNRFYQDLFKLIPGVPDESSKYYLSCPGLAISTVLLENVGLYIENFSGIPYTDEENKTLMRFGKVFEQAYIRFNDLKQAEEQARESQIQLALERVRARTMAMQRSEELSNVATVLFQQVKSLGVPQWTCGFCIWDIGDTESMWYPGSPDGEILAPMRFPLTEHPVFRIMDESRKRGDELYIYEKEGEVQADHYRYMMTLPGVRESLQGMLDAGLTIPTFQIDHYANFAYGNLIFITYEHFPEMHDIFKRFAKVFEQTYTRFLDLQKAEAQAREAQIEAALERVRAKAMAMHSSEDLAETIKAFYHQMGLLNLMPRRCGVGLIDEETHTADLTGMIISEQGEAKEIAGKLKFEEHP